MTQFDRYGIPPPVTGEDFERLCWDLWRAIWNDPATQMNGRRGQRQRGVDIFGKPEDGSGWAAIQCKAKDIRRNAQLTFKEVNAEVDQAKLFLPPLEQLTIATTCMADVILQEKVRQLSDDLCAQGLFSVAVLSWEEICRRLSDFPAVVGRHYPAFAPRRLTEGIQTLSSNFAGRISNFLAEYLGSRGKAIPFGGRSSTMQELTDWLESDEAPPYLLLTAPAGRGKSALLAQWISGQSIRSDMHVVYFPVSIRFRTNLKSVIFPSLAARLAHIHGETAPSLSDLPSEAGLGLVCDLLSRPTPDGKPVLLVIDGLDEAADFSPGRSLIPLAPWDGLRVVVAVRSQIGERDGSNWLAELGWLDLGLAKTVCLNPLSAAGVADVLQNMGNPLDALGKRAEVVQALYKLTGGDPLLVRLYVDDLRNRSELAPHLGVEDLRAFQPGFSGYMARWWNEQRSLWKERGQEALVDEETRVRAVLAILTSTFGPITLSELVQLISRDKGLSRNALRDCLDPIARFIIGDGISLGYTFSHPRMAEYFRDEELTPDEVAAADWRLREWCESSLAAMKSGTLPPEAVSGYVVQYYGAHLEASGGTSDQMIGLINESWLAAWRERDPTLIGFLNDVDRGFNACGQAVRTRVAENEHPISYGPLFLATLSHASVNSMAGNIPADLLALLVKERIWSATQALAYARRMANDWGVIDALVTLAPLLPEAVLVEGIDGIGLITDEDARLEALRGIVGVVPTEMMDHVVAVAAGFEGDAAKADVIAALSGRLDAATSRSAFGLSATMTDEESLATSLIALARTLPESYLKSAVEIALQLSDEEMRADVLSCLVSRLTENSDTYERALRSALEIGDEYERLRLLAGFIRTADRDDLVQIIASIRASGDESIREAAMVRCARIRPPETLAILRELGDDILQASDQFLVASAPSLDPEDRKDLARRLLERPDDDDALLLLAGLIPFLSGDALAMVAEAADDPKRSSYDRHVVTVALLPHLPEPDRRDRLAAALAAAKALADEWDRYETIRDLVPFACDGLVERAAAAIAEIGSADIRRQLLEDLSRDLPAEQYAAVASKYIDFSEEETVSPAERIALLPAFTEAKLAGLIRSGKYGPDEMLELVEHSRRHFDKDAFTRLVGVAATYCRTSRDFEAFCARHAGSLPPNVFASFISKVPEFEDRDLRVEYTVAAAPQVPPKARSRLLLDLLKSLQEISDAQTTLAAQFRLVPHLGPDHLAAMLGKIERLDDSDTKLEAFRMLVDHLPAALHPSALGFARGMDGSRRRASALTDLAIRQNGPAREATLAAMRETLEDADLVECLVSVGARGDPALAEEALDRAHEMGDSLAAAAALARLVRSGLYSLEAAARRASAIRDPVVAASVTLHLARSRPLTDKELELFLAGADPRTRVALLLDNPEMTPPPALIELSLAGIRELGDDEVAAEVVSLFLEHFPQGHVESLLGVAMEIEDEWLNGIALALLSDQVDDDRRREILADLIALKDPALKVVSLRIVECLATLDRDLPRDLARYEIALLVAAMPYSQLLPDKVQAWVREIFFRAMARIPRHAVEAFPKYIFGAGLGLSGAAFEFINDLMTNVQSFVSEGGYEFSGRKRRLYALPRRPSFGISPFLEEVDASQDRFGEYLNEEPEEGMAPLRPDVEEISPDGRLDRFDAAFRAMLSAKRLSRTAAVDSLISLVPSMQASGGSAAGDELVDAIDDIERWFP